MENRPVVFIAHPIRGDVEGNLQQAAAWLRWAAKECGVLPVAPYFGYLEALDDDNLQERNIGLTACRSVLVRCDELWLCGSRVSKGMKYERILAEKRGIPIVDLTTKRWIF